MNQPTPPSAFLESILPAERDTIRSVAKRLAEVEADLAKIEDDKSKLVSLRSSIDRQIAEVEKAIAAAAASESDRIDRMLRGEKIDDATSAVFLRQRLDVLRNDRKNVHDRIVRSYESTELKVFSQLRNVRAELANAIGVPVMRRIHEQVGAALAALGPDLVAWIRSGPSQGYPSVRTNGPEVLLNLDGFFGGPAVLRDASVDGLSWAKAIAAEVTRGELASSGAAARKVKP